MFHIACCQMTGPVSRPDRLLGIYRIDFRSRHFVPVTSQGGSVLAPLCVVGLTPGVTRWLR